MAQLGCGLADSPATSGAHVAYHRSAVIHPLCCLDALLASSGSSSFRLRWLRSQEKRLSRRLGGELQSLTLLIVSGLIQFPPPYYHD